jgi:ADP-heptose:LPS heptosyltransferase
MSINRAEVKSILVIRRNNIGDMICAVPLLKTLRRAFPDARITVLADSANAGIISGASFVDRVLVCGKNQKGVLGGKYAAYLATLRGAGEKYDLCVAVKIGFSSLLALITQFSGARYRFGCQPTSWHPLQYAYNLPVRGWKKWKTLHQIDGLLEFIKALGISDVVKDIRIDVTADSAERIDSFIRCNGLETVKLVVFNVSNNRPENNWSPDRFVELGSLLAEQYGVVSILTATPADRERAGYITQRLPGAVFCETATVMDFAALVARSQLLVCGEGGAMHVGAAVGTPTVSLWAQDRPKKWTPFGENQIIIHGGETVDTISVGEVSDLIGPIFLDCATSITSSRLKRQEE